MVRKAVTPSMRLDGTKASPTQRSRRRSGRAGASACSGVAAGGRADAPRERHTAAAHAPSSNASAT